MERRKHPRYGLGVRLKLVLDGEREAVRPELINLSTGGCLLGPLPELKPGWAVSVTFLADGRLCGATGAAVRADERGVGIEFASTNEAMSEFLRDMGHADADRRRALTARLSDGEVRLG